MTYKNVFILTIKDVSVRKQLKLYGKLGNPQSLDTIVIFKTNQTKSFVMGIPGVLDVEEETTDSPFNVEVQPRPLSWFLPSASNTVPNYTYNRTGKDVAVYVMDSGIRIDHDEFAGRDISTVFSYDGLDYGGDVDGPDHGTMAASCAAGNEHGIAKEATIYNVRYNWSSIEGLKALDTVLAHHRTHSMPSILSMSFGSQSNVYDRAFTQLAREGVVLVAAAGNYDDPHATFPARRDDVIAVAACDNNLEPSVWGGSTPGTNYGPEIDIWAGGTGGVAGSIFGASATQWAGGTSSACPLVAGATALILEGIKKPDTYDEVLEIKSRLLDQSREDVINYTDAKFDGTANRYIFTLVDDGIPLPPDVEPTPDEEDEESGRNLPLIIGAIVVLGLLALALL